MRRIAAFLWTLLFAYALVGVLVTFMGRALGYPEIVLFSWPASLAALLVMALAWRRSRHSWAEWIERRRA